MRAVILVLMLWPILSNGQSIKETKTDQFTGVTTISTTTEILSKYPRLDITGQTYMIKGVKAQFISLGVYPHMVASVSKESKVILKLSNGDVLSIPRHGEAEIFSPGDYLIYSIPLNVELIKFIQGNTIKAIRFENSKFPLDFEISPKYQNTFNKTVNLLIE